MKTSYNLKHHLKHALYKHDITQKQILIKAFVTQSSWEKQTLWQHGGATYTLMSF